MNGFAVFVLVAAIVLAAAGTGYVVSWLTKSLLAFFIVLIVAAALYALIVGLIIKAASA